MHLWSKNWLVNIPNPNTAQIGFAPKRLDMGYKTFLKSSGGWDVVLLGSENREKVSRQFGNACETQSQKTETPRPLRALILRPRSMDQGATNTFDKIKPILAWNLKAKFTCISRGAEHFASTFIVTVTCFTCHKRDQDSIYLSMKNNRSKENDCSITTHLNIMPGTSKVIPKSKSRECNSKAWTCMSKWGTKVIKEGIGTPWMKRSAVPQSNWRRNVVDGDR